MKKILLVVAVLMLAAPAWAVTVDIWAVQVGDTNEVEIWYETDGNLPRAFGLNITVTAGNIVDCVPAMTGESSSGNRGYGIFPGTIVIIDGEVNDFGTPVAPNDFPDTQPGIGTPAVTIEMGSLYYPATGLASPNSPLASDLLCTLTVSAECDVNIAGNAARTGTGSGGIGVVMEDPDEVPTVSFTGCTVVIVEWCTVPNVVNTAEAAAKTAITDAGFVNGVRTTACNATIGAGKVISTTPAGGVSAPCDSAVDREISTGPCTCACLGDINRDNQKSNTDYNMLKGRLNQAKGLTGLFEVVKGSEVTGHLYDICADLNSDGKLTNTDYNMLRGKLNVCKSNTGSFVCPCP